MKKIIVISMVILVICVSFIIFIGLISNADEKAVTFTGIKATHKSPNLGTGFGSDRLDPINDYEEAKIMIASLYFEDDAAYLTGSVLVEEVMPFHFSGSLFNSHKQTLSLKVYVGEMIDEKDHFKINFFEVKDDYGTDLYKMQESMLGKRTLTLDFMDKYNNLYYFEIDLDQLIADTSKINVNKTASREIDYLQYVIEEVGPH